MGRDPLDALGGGPMNIRHYFYGGPRDGDEVSLYEGDLVASTLLVPIRKRINTTVAPANPQPPVPAMREVAHYRRLLPIRFGSTAERVVWIYEGRDGVGYHESDLSALVALFDEAMVARARRRDA